MTEWRQTVRLGDEKQKRKLLIPCHFITCLLLPKIQAKKKKEENQIQVKDTPLNSNRERNTSLWCLCCH